MSEVPKFRKPDRYKSSSYRAYNSKMPGYYDSAWFIEFMQAPLWHQIVVGALRPDIESIDILDVGCGTGTLLHELAKSGARSLAGVDLAPKILEVAQQKLSASGAEADLRVADAEDSLPWDADFFDVATLTGSLHHFFRPNDMLAEVYRTLRPSGRLLVVDPCFFTPLRQLSNVYLRILPHDGDFHFYSAVEARRLLTENGFECSKPTRVGRWAFFICATKATTRN